MIYSFSRKSRFLVLAKLILAVSIGVFLVPVGNNQTAWAETDALVSLFILNAPDPTTEQIILTKGQDVEVEYITPAAADLGASDLIQLRRLDTGEVVNQVARGDQPQGIVLLDTDFDNALGELKVIYFHFTQSGGGSVIAEADQTVHVIGDVPPEPPAMVEVPSSEAPTIQAAINLVADGGTVEIARGVYEEILWIHGKEVNLVGSGTKKGKSTILRGPGPAVFPPLAGDALALIKFTDGGGGTVRDIRLERGDAGIHGIDAANLLIKDVVFAEGGWGILGSYFRLTIRDMEISDAVWRAIELKKIAAFEMYDSFISNADHVGLLIFNLDYSPGIITIADSAFENNTEGGIVIVGDAKPVYITDSVVDIGSLAGIFLINTGFVEIRGTRVTGIFNADVPGHGYIGDGLIALNTGYTRVVDSSFYFCERAGLLFDNSAGEILNTTSLAGRFGLVVFYSPSLEYDSADNFFRGTDEDILVQGDLGVPNEAPPLPDP